jgi:hypothetical protein
MLEMLVSKVLELLGEFFFNILVVIKVVKLSLTKSSYDFIDFFFVVKGTSLNYHLRLRKSSMINTLDKNCSSKFALKYEQGQKFIKILLEHLVSLNVLNKTNHF